MSYSLIKGKKKYPVPFPNKTIVMAAAIGWVLCISHVQANFVILQRIADHSFIKISRSHQTTIIIIIVIVCSVAS